MKRLLTVLIVGVLLLLAFGLPQAAAFSEVVILSCNLGAADTNVVTFVDQNGVSTLTGTVLVNGVSITILSTDCSGAILALTSEGHLKLFGVSGHPSGQLYLLTENRND